MNTCKATLRVLFSHRAYLLIYLVFVGIMMLSISWSMLSGTSDSAAAAFEPAKMRVAVIDRDSDRGGIASSMRTYLSDSSELVNVDDASETLQQAVASNWVDLIVIIPDGFADDFIDAAATGENPPSVDTVTSYTSGAGSMARMNVIGFLSLTRTALIGSHTTVDSAALAAMAGIDIGDTAGDSSEDGMGGFGEFSNQDMLDMLPAGQIEKPSVGDLFEASKAAAASASDMDANHKVAVIDTASADAESASDMAASRFGNTMKTALYPLFLAMTVCGSMILGIFTTGEVRRRLTASPQRMSSMGLQRLLTLSGFALVVCVGYLVLAVGLMVAAGLDPLTLSAEGVLMTFCATCQVPARLVVLHRDRQRARLRHGGRYRGQRRRLGRLPGIGRAVRHDVHLHRLGRRPLPPLATHLGRPGHHTNGRSIVSLPPAGRRRYQLFSR